MPLSDVETKKAREYNFSIPESIELISLTFVLLQRTAADGYYYA